MISTSTLSARGRSDNPCRAEAAAGRRRRDSRPENPQKHPATPPPEAARAKGSKTMALFGAVSSKDVDAFAKELAEELSKRYPPALDQSGGQTLSEKRLTRILEDVCNKAAEFKNEHK